MSRFVRPSKYRHTYSQAGRKECNYENVKVSASAWDTDLVKASSKYLSINTQVSGGGAFLLLPLPTPFNPPPLPSKLPDILPLARGHTAPVLDTAFNPFNPSQLVSSGEDGKILFWDLSKENKFEGWGEDGWKSPGDWESAGVVGGGGSGGAGGGRKVGWVGWNPVAEGVLASAGADQLVKIWDFHKPDKAVLSLSGHKDMIQSVTWSYRGDLVVTASRDKKIRLFDPRAGSEPVKTADGHGGIKGSRVIWLGDRDRFLSTGFSRMSERQISLWDASSFTAIRTESIDSSSGVLMPHYIEGNNVILLAGKGDGNIRFYEYADDELYYLNEHKSTDPQRGFSLLPRHAVDVSQNEIARGFKLTTSTVEPISFIIPRKAENFQSDIFPPAPAEEPAMTTKEWFDGKTSPPKVIDLESKAPTSYEGITDSIPKSTPTPTPAPEKKTSTPPSTETSELKKDVPLTQTSDLPSRGGSFGNPRDLEIKQDDSEDEEETDAKRRAPDDDDFASEAGAEVVDVSGGGQGKEMEKQEVKQEEKKVVESAVAPAASAPSGSSSAEVDSLKSEIAQLQKRLESVLSENNKLKSQVDKAKTLAKELAGL